MFGRGDTIDGNPFEYANNHSDSSNNSATLGTCRQTHIYPFRVGCPETCQRATSSDEPMYRMSIAWYLANPTLPQGAAYDKGYNYQCPKAFVDNFRTAGMAMQTSIPTATNGLYVGHQDRMHISLSYLCCLRRNETDWAREVMYQWVLEQYPFHVNVALDRLECWHIRPNSVTVIVVADDATQRALLRLNLDLQHKLLQRGIPTEVARVDQMAFHVTLSEVYRDEDRQYNASHGHDDAASMANPKNDIRPNLAEIYQHVSNYSRIMGTTTWMGGEQMQIRHAPYFTFDRTLHAGKEPMQ
jgi:hypothetical protein